MLGSSHGRIFWRKNGGPTRVEGADFFDDFDYDVSDDEEALLTVSELMEHGELGNDE